MTWKIILKEYQYYLKIERGMTQNTIVSYALDVQKLIDYLDEFQIDKSVENISEETLREFVYHTTKQLGTRSQARLISSLKNFFKYVISENYRSDYPMELIESPKFGTKLPDTLSVEEIDALIAAVDVSTDEGHRNRAIIETLYGCGLRVSELVSMRLSDLFFEEGFIQVRGKGNKERLVPISSYTQKFILHYTENQRKKLNIQKGNEDFVFLNRRGKQLTRAMIFTIIRQLAEKINLQKTISPHTFRHSFATHLLENGANLRAIQMMLGHENITTTEIYMHTDKSQLRKIINKYHPRR